MDFGGVYEGKTVLVTGHTGFKGSWLCEWLLMLGAKVVGYSLEPETSPCHYEELGLEARLSADLRGDVRSLENVQGVLREHQPDYIFHLAAQSLVRRSFSEPYATTATNVMGTVNVLEALRLENRACVAIMITTDKVYRNVEWLHAYREPDPLGGYDTYSASKAAADIMISSYQQSFFGSADAPRMVAVSARGGNVIGGGDWALDRIVPDAMRSLSAGERIPVRNRHATRPWQHVLELLNGYMTLAAALSDAEGERLSELSSAFNFGPYLSSNRPVENLVEEILKHWSGSWEDFTDPNAVHEAGKLNLSIDRAYHLLGWQPRWGFEATLEQTVSWYRQFYEEAQGHPDRVQALTKQQIEAYASG